MGCLLGIDMGEKRIGVAVSDETQTLAEPLTTIIFHGREPLKREIEKIIALYGVEKIVVGLPVTMKGEIGPSAKKILAQVDWLKQAVDRPWVMWDERLSTAEAERILLMADLSRSRRKQVRDRVAAQRILQNYLDHHKGKL